MIVTINNEEDLITYQDLYSVSKRTLPFTIRQIAANNCNVASIEVQVHRSLLAAHHSYLVNPSQLAKNTNVDQLFAKARGVTRGEYVIIHFSNAPTPLNFFGQCLQAANEGQNITFNFDEIPLTYQHNPSLLRYRIKSATGVKVTTNINRAKNKIKITVPYLRLKK